MAKWTAKCWLGSSSGYVNLEVEAATINGAKEQLENIYHAEQIINLREISSNSGGIFNGSSSSTSSSGSGVGALVVGGLILFVFFAEWILMVGAGAGATWISQKITGLNVQEYGDKPKEETTDIDNRNALIIFASAIIFGGVGFAGGHNLKESWNDESASIPTRYSQVQKTIISEIKSPDISS